MTDPATLAGLGGDFATSTSKYYGSTINSYGTVVPIVSKDVVTTYLNSPIDTSVSASTYGKPIPLSIGNRRIAGNMIWALPLIQSVTGWKTGSTLTFNNTNTEATQTTTVSAEYAYKATFAVSFGFSLGPLKGARLLRLWANSVLIYDGGTRPSWLRWYPGTEDQGPDPAIVADKGVEAPSYRPHMYVVIEDLDISPYGNAIPTIIAEIADVPGITPPELFTGGQESPTTTGIDGSADNITTIFDFAGNLAYSISSAPTYLSTAKTIVTWDLVAKQKIAEHAISQPYQEINLIELHRSSGCLVALASLTIDGYAFEKLVTINPANGNVVGVYDTLSGGAGSLTRTTNPKQKNAGGWQGLLEGDHGSIFVQCFPISDTSTTRNYRGFRSWSISGDGATITLLHEMTKNTFPFYSGDTGDGGGAFDCYQASGERGGAGAYTFHLSLGYTSTTSTIGGYTVFSVSVSSSGVPTFTQRINEAAGSTYKAPVGSYYYQKYGTFLVYYFTAPSGSARVIKYKADWSVDYDVPVSDGVNVAGAQFFAESDSDRNADYWITVEQNPFDPSSTWGTTKAIHIPDGIVTEIDFGYWGSTPAYDADAYTIYWSNWADQFTTNPSTGYPFSGNNGPGYSFAQFTTLGRIPLSQIIVYVASTVGYLPGEVTCSGIDDLVDGCIIDADFAYSDFLAQLAGAFGFDVQTTTVIRCVRVPTGASLVIDRALAATDILDINSQAIVSQRSQANDAPTNVEIRYLDANLDYTYANQIAHRPQFPIRTTNNDTTKTWTIPVVITAAEAAGLAARALYKAANERLTHQMKLLPSQLALEPSDVVTFPLDGRTITAKLYEASIGADNSVNVIANNLWLDGNLTATADANVSVGSVNARRAESKVAILDTVLQAIGDDTGHASLRLYLAVSPALAGLDWPGAQILYSADGTTYTALGDVVFTPALTADAVTVLGSTAAPWETDRVNTVSLTYRAGDLTKWQSRSYADLNAGLNLAALGAPGRWELIQFETVTFDPGGTVTLSGLRRGLKGSETSIGTHAVGDVFVLLDGTSVLATTLDLATLGTTVSFKALGRGESAADVTATTYLVQGSAEKPFAPVFLTASVSGSDIALGWTRRDRLDPGLHDSNATVPLSESSEAYELDIMASATSSTVKRTLTASTTAATYTASQITTDFGTMPASLTFRVYQISAQVGRGYRATATITL